MRLDIFFSQPPPPPQYDLLRRRSHAVVTRLDGPTVAHTLTQQTEPEGTFPLQAGIDVFCVLALQGPRTRGKIFHLKQTSRQNPKKQLQNMSPLARCSQNCRRTSNNEGLQHGVPSKPSSLIQEGNGLSIHSCREAEDFFVCICSCLSIFLSAEFSRLYQADTRVEDNVSVERGRDWDTLARWTRCSFQAGYGHLGSCFSQRVLLYRNAHRLNVVGSLSYCNNQHRTPYVWNMAY